MNRRIPLRRPPARPGAWSESGVLGSTRILFIASLQISTAPSTNRSRPSGENYYATRPHILILYGETFLVYSTSRSPYSPCTSSFSSYSSPFLPLTFPFLPSSAFSSSSSSSSFKFSLISISHSVGWSVRHAVRKRTKRRFDLRCCPCPSLRD